MSVRGPGHVRARTRAPESARFGGVAGPCDTPRASGQPSTVPLTMVVAETEVTGGGV
jgi:hypothetical protein